MTALLWLLAAALVVAGVIGVLVPGLPGAPLVFAGILLAAALDGFARIGPLVLAGELLLAVAASLAGHAASVLGARRLGASAWGLAGAFLGLLVGAAFALPGILLGPFLGALALELVGARRRRPEALRAGAGAFLGLVAGIVLQGALVAVMIGAAVLAYLL